MYIVVENIQASAPAGLKLKWIEERRIGFFRTQEEASNFVDLNIELKSKVLKGFLEALAHDEELAIEMKDEAEEFRRNLFSLSQNEETFTVLDRVTDEPLKVTKEIYWILKEEATIVTAYRRQ